MARLPPSCPRRVFALVGWSVAMAMQVALCVPAAAQTARAAVSSPEVTNKVDRARQRGYWVIEEGDHLYRISRYFVTDPVQVRELAKELADLNPDALIYGDATRLVVGARLQLPKRLVEVAPEPAIAVAEPPARAAQPASTAVPPPRATQPAPVAVPKDTPLAAPVAATTPAAPGTPVTAAPPPATAATPPAQRPPPYVDRLMAGAPTAEEDAREEARQADTRPGLRSVSTELRTEHREATSIGNTDAQALALRLSQETERFGDFTLAAQLSHLSPPSGGPEHQRTRASGTLFQDNFALTPDFIATSALGVVRPTLPNWLSTSYRVLIAPALLAGAATTIASPTQEFRFSTGQLGRYGGIAIQDFERTSGSQTSASFTQRLPGDWQAGATAVTVHGSETVTDHTAASLAIQRAHSTTGDGVKLQAAMTNDHEAAAWLDAQVHSGRLTQRFGAYHADPDFRFGESATARDVRGVYWRGDYRLTGNYFGGGIEAVQENLRRDPTRGGNDSLGAFGNIALRLDRNTQVGAGLSFRSEDPRVPTGIERNVGTTSAFISHRWALGQTRLDWNLYESRPVMFPSERSQVINWNQDWPTLFGIDVTTLLGFSDERLVDRHTKRRTASLALRGPVAGNLRWNASVTAVDVDEQASNERNYNASAGIDWNISPDWTMQLQWYRNQVQPGPDNGLVPFMRENTVQLNVRYETTSGTPYPRVGGSGGRSGAGTIAGSVFFDENGDGVRGPIERGASGVVVILDDRQSVVTDNEGRFRFALVPAGRHRVRVVVERVALPWGLQDESAREVAVDVRADARLDIGLVKIAP